MEILGFVVLAAAVLFIGYATVQKIKAPLWPYTRAALGWAVLVRFTTLSSTDVLAQLDNFMTREDKIAVEAILMRLDSLEVIELFRPNGDWRAIYEAKGFTREERAILDEWLEDVMKITESRF